MTDLKKGAWTREVRPRRTPTLATTRVREPCNGVRSPPVRPPARPAPPGSPHSLPCRRAVRAAAPTPPPPRAVPELLEVTGLTQKPQQPAGVAAAAAAAASGGAAKAFLADAVEVIGPAELHRLLRWGERAPDGPAGVVLLDVRSTEEAVAGCVALGACGWAWAQAALAGPRCCGPPLLRVPQRCPCAA